MMINDSDKCVNRSYFTILLCIRRLDKIKNHKTHRTQNDDCQTRKIRLTTTTFRYVWMNHNNRMLILCYSRKTEWKMAKRDAFVTFALTNPTDTSLLSIANYAVAPQDDSILNAKTKRFYLIRSQAILRSISDNKKKEKNFFFFHEL